MKRTHWVSSFVINLQFMSTKGHSCFNSLVDFAAFVRPWQNTCFSSFLKRKFAFAPFTEIISFGFGISHSLTRSVTSLERWVLESTLMYCKWNGTSGALNLPPLARLIMRRTNDKKRTLLLVFPPKYISPKASVGRVTVSLSGSQGRCWSFGSCRSCWVSG